jgi:hypothetical protein
MDLSVNVFQRLIDLELGGLVFALPVACLILSLVQILLWLLEVQLLYFVQIVSVMRHLLFFSTGDVYYLWRVRFAIAILQLYSNISKLNSRTSIHIDLSAFFFTLIDSAQIVAEAIFSSSDSFSFCAIDAIINGACLVKRLLCCLTL